MNREIEASLHRVAQLEHQLAEEAEQLRLFINEEWDARNGNLPEPLAAVEMAGRCSAACRCAEGIDMAAELAGLFPEVTLVAPSAVMARTAAEVRARVAAGRDGQAEVTRVA